VREQEIEDEKIGGRLEDALEPGFAVALGENAVPLAGQVVAHQLADFRLVVDDQDRRARGRRHLGPVSSRGSS